MSALISALYDRQGDSNVTLLSGIEESGEPRSAIRTVIESVKW